MNYWLVKSEADLYPISKLKKDKKVQWCDIRNYQARIYLREMKVSDECLYYHSNTAPTGIVGIAVVSKLAFPDPGQFDKNCDYFDPKSTIEVPRWFAPELKFKVEFPYIISMETLKKEKALSEMMLFKNSRLSVQKVTSSEFDKVLALSR